MYYISLLYNVHDIEIILGYAFDNEPVLKQSFELHTVGEVSCKKFR